MKERERKICLDTSKKVFIYLEFSEWLMLHFGEEAYLDYIYKKKLAQRLVDNHVSKYGNND
jgi:hypothetical protein